MKNKNLALILVLAVIAIIVIGMGVYYSHLSSMTESGEPTGNPITAPLPPIATSTVATTTPAQPTQPQNNPTPKPPVPVTKTYSDTTDGLTFKYPSGFATTFASFTQTQPKVIISNATSTAVNGNGCYVLNDSTTTPPSIGTLGTNRVCVSVGSGVGAGQLYNDYYYTTLHNGNYYTLGYTVHIPNSCGAYVGTASAQACADFMKNYTSLVIQPIQNSVATLTFTK